MFRESPSPVWAARVYVRVVVRSWKLSTLTSRQSTSWCQARFGSRFGITPAHSEATAFDEQRKQRFSRPCWIEGSS